MILLRFDSFLRYLEDFLFQPKRRKLNGKFDELYITFRFEDIWSYHVLSGQYNKHPL